MYDSEELSTYELLVETSNLIQMTRTLYSFLSTHPVISTAYTQEIPSGHQTIIAKPVESQQLGLPRIGDRPSTVAMVRHRPLIGAVVVR